MLPLAFHSLTRHKFSFLVAFSLAYLFFIPPYVLPLSSSFSPFSVPFKTLIFYSSYCPPFFIFSSPTISFPFSHLSHNLPVLLSLTTTFRSWLCSLFIISSHIFYLRHSHYLSSFLCHMLIFHSSLQLPFPSPHYTLFPSPPVSPSLSPPSFSVSFTLCLLVPPACLSLVRHAARIGKALL